jgi:hypothetical protein
MSKDLSGRSMFSSGRRAKGSDDRDKSVWAKGYTGIHILATAGHMYQAAAAFSEMRYC